MDIELTVTIRSDAPLDVVRDRALYGIASRALVIRQARVNGHAIDVAPYAVAAAQAAMPATNEAKLAAEPKPAAKKSGKKQAK